MIQKPRDPQSLLQVLEELVTVLLPVHDIQLSCNAPASAGLREKSIGIFRIIPIRSQKS